MSVKISLDFLAHAEPGLNALTQGLDGLPVDEVRAIIRRRIEADLPHIESAQERHDRERLELRRRETDTLREAREAEAAGRAQERTNARANEAIAGLPELIDRLVEAKIEERVATLVNDFLLGDEHSELLARLVARERGMTREAIKTAVAESEARTRRAAGSLPIARPWTRDSAALPGELWTFRGSTWQALRRTGQTPGTGDHWQVFARAGKDGAQTCPRGQWDERKGYARLDIVNHRDVSYLATRDHPGRPGSGEKSGWQVIAAKGERGESGPRGHRGAEGKQAETPVIVQWLVDAERYRASPLFSNGEVGAQLELRPLFELFNIQTS